MKTSVTVDTTAGGVELVPADAMYKFVCFQVITAGVDVHVDFVRDNQDAVALTSSNGIKFTSESGPQMFANGNPSSLFKNGIKAIAASGSATVIVQYH